MQVLEKTAQTLKRNIHLLIFINLIFAATTFSLLYFTGKKIQEYVLAIYAYAPQLQELESVLSEDVSIADLNKLNESLAVINQSYRMVFIVTIASIIAFFLIWCFFQSVEWRITYSSLKKKIGLEDVFENYWKYTLNFSIITIPALLILFPSFYYLVAQVKALFLNLIIKLYGISEAAPETSYTLIALLFAIVLFTSYFTIIAYVMLNKYKLWGSIKRSFKTGIKRFRVLLPIHLSCLLIIIPILYLDSYITRLIDFKAAAIMSILIYFAILAFYQNLMVVLLEKE